MKEKVLVSDSHVILGEPDSSGIVVFHRIDLGVILFLFLTTLDIVLNMSVLCSFVVKETQLGYVLFWVDVALLLSLFVSFLLMRA